MDDLANLPRFRAFETFVHSVNRASLSQLLSGLLSNAEPQQIVTVNMDFLRIAEREPSLRRVINSAALSVPDGAPLVWMARYLGLRECQRVTGTDLIEAAAELSAKDGCGIYLLGGAAGAPEAARQALERRFPGVRICGTFAPPEATYPFPAELDSEICESIRQAAPDILFVGFGCPKQDLWISEHLHQLGVGVSVGIGGCFNFLSGRISRAPVRLQHAGLEWAYRLCKEPRRLWRRYLLNDLPFALRLAMAQAATRSSQRHQRPLGIQS